jgi:hypothetical protein
MLVGVMGLNKGEILVVVPCKSPDFDENWFAGIQWEILDLSQILS